MSSSTWTLHERPSSTSSSPGSQLPVRRVNSPIKAGGDGKRGGGWVDEFSRLRSEVERANKAEKTARSHCKAAEMSLQQALAESRRLERELVERDEILNVAISAAQQSAEAELTTLAAAAARERSSAVNAARQAMLREQQPIQDAAVAAAKEEGAAAATARAAATAEKVAAQAEALRQASVAVAREEVQAAMTRAQEEAVAAAIARTKEETDALAAVERERALSQARSAAAASLAAALAGAKQDAEAAQVSAVQLAIAAAVRQEAANDEKHTVAVAPEACRATLHAAIELCAKSRCEA